MPVGRPLERRSEHGGVEHDQLEIDFPGWGAVGQRDVLASQILSGFEPGLCQPTSGEHSGQDLACLSFHRPAMRSRLLLEASQHLVVEVAHG
jgi:hypothetical protein